MDELIERGLCGDKLSTTDRDVLVRILRDQYNVSFDCEDMNSVSDKDLTLGICYCMANQGVKCSYFDGLDVPETIEEDQEESMEPRDVLDAVPDLLELTGRLESGMDLLGSLSERYLNLTARLGQAGVDVAPLDFHGFVMNGEDTTEAIEGRLRHIKEEKMFWEHVLSLIDQTDEEELEQNDEFRSFEAFVESYRKELDNTKDIWGKAKAQLSKQTYSRLMASRFKLKAKEINDTIPRSLLKIKRTAQERSDISDLEHLLQNLVDDDSIRILRH